MPRVQAFGTNAPDPISNEAVLDWMHQYQAQRRRCDEENGALRNIIKRAKSDGINTKALIQAVAATKLDPDQVKADLHDFIRYAALRRMPVSQDDLFGDLDLTLNSASKQADDAWDADENGYRAGRHGAQIDDCPYPHGTELALHWTAGWRKGQSAIAHELGENAQMASTSKARPRAAKSQPTLSGVIGEPQPAEPDGETEDFPDNAPAPEQDNDALGADDHAGDENGDDGPEAPPRRVARARKASAGVKRPRRVVAEASIY